MSHSQERKVPALIDYTQVECVFSHQVSENLENNGQTFFERTRRSIIQLVNKWTLKEIFVALIIVCLTLLVIILAIRAPTTIIYCEQNKPMTKSNIYPIPTMMPTELVCDFDLHIFKPVDKNLPFIILKLTNYFHQEIHFNILPNTILLICENTPDHINDSICLNLPVFDTNSDKMIEMKIMKNVEHSFDMNVRPFHPFDYILLSIGEYLVQFNMSIFRHVKHLNNDSSAYGVTMKLDEKTLVSCLPGQLGNLSLHETEPCSFLPAPDRKYFIDFDEEYTFVQSLISFNLNVKVESDEAKLRLMFAQEGFVDYSTIIIAKKFVEI